MSELAERERLVKRSWAAPGGLHDRLVGILKIGLPVIVGLLIAYLALAPLQKSREISFILDKNKVEVAKERMRVETARYQGLDEQGRPFTISAESAVQESSQDPIVQIFGMRAGLRLPEGPAVVQALRGFYDLDGETVRVVGPVLFQTADGYRLRTSDVAVNLHDRTMTGSGRVEGEMPLGRFSADRMKADLPSRTIVLEGRTRLHIVQGGLR